MFATLTMPYTSNLCLIDYITDKHIKSNLQTNITMMQKQLVGKIDQNLVFWCELQVVQGMQIVES